MGSLGDRVRALEGRGGIYPEHVVAEAMRRIPTEELRSYVEMLTTVVDGGAPVAEAEPAVRRITELCQKIEKENSHV